MLPLVAAPVLAPPVWSLAPLERLPEGLAWPIVPVVRAQRPAQPLAAPKLARSSQPRFLVLRRVSVLADSRGQAPESVALLRPQRSCPHLEIAERSHQRA